MSNPPDHYDRLRRPLTHWTIRTLVPETGEEEFQTCFDRGDAVVTICSGRRQMMDPEEYEALVYLANAALDHLIDEARCEESGGHTFETFDEGEWCSKCSHLKRTDA